MGLWEEGGLPFCLSSSAVPRVSALHCNPVKLPNSVGAPGAEHALRGLQPGVDSLGSQ